MKVLKKVIVAVLLIMVLAFVACGGRPQPVTQAQFDAARQYALDAETQVVALRAEHSRLEAELAARNAKLRVLQELLAEQEQQ